MAALARSVQSRSGPSLIASRVVDRGPASEKLLRHFEVPLSSGNEKWTAVFLVQAVSRRAVMQELADDIGMAPLRR